jgi:hypothetical protein
MKKSQYPKGWDEARVRKVIDYYDRQSEEEEAAEIERLLKRKDESSMMLVPSALVPEFRKMIAAHMRRGRSRTRKMKGAA